MTGQEIVTKAVSKAVKNGWGMLGRDTSDWKVSGDTTFLIKTWRDEVIEVNGRTLVTRVPTKLRFENIMYRHDFAKALWGEEKCDWGAMGSVFVDREWQYHLQQMVIAEDPIEYLGDNL